MVKNDEKIQMMNICMYVQKAKSSSKCIKLLNSFISTKSKCFTEIYIKDDHDKNYDLFALKYVSNIFFCFVLKIFPLKGSTFYLHKQ